MKFTSTRAFFFARCCLGFEAMACCCEHLLIALGAICAARLLWGLLVFIAKLVLPPIDLRKYKGENTWAVVTGAPMVWCGVPVL